MATSQKKAFEYLLTLIYPVRQGIISHLSKTDCFNLCLAVGPDLHISQPLAERLWSSPCEDPIPPAPYPICRQAPAQNPFVSVRKCQGFLTHFHNKLTIPRRNSEGRWPTPTIRHSFHFGDRYVCANCILRNSLELQRTSTVSMKTKHWTNLCKKHSAKPPFLGPSPTNCFCYSIFNPIDITKNINDRANASSGWQCYGCRRDGYARVRLRAKAFRQDLQRTRRRKYKRSDRTLETYIDNRDDMVINGVTQGRRKNGGVACPVAGCGRSAQTKEDDPELMKMCLGCCAIIHANEF